MFARPFGRLSAALFFVFMALSVTPSSAGELPRPEGKVLLTVEGKIANTTDGRAALFDRAQLEAMGLQELRTSNPFVEEVHTYEGVLLSKI
ncbi:MAG: hypothetical protein HQL36_12700, partial [Alphaproteobacteria bacterium]|nr:hypothetical protein [Alphaproteobacteria bacterium]